MGSPKKSTNRAIRWIGDHWKWLIALGIIAGVVGFGWQPVLTWITGSTAPPAGTAADFDVIAMDAPRNLVLPNNAFNFTLWGLTSSDTTDFGNFEEINTGDSLSDISASDLDPDYVMWVLKAAGTVEADWWDTDDAAVIDDIDTTYDHVYYERFFILSKTAVNTLMFYEEPSDGNFQVVDSQSFDTVNVTAGIEAQTNVTLFAGTNQSQPYAKWVSGPNYENELADAPSWIVTTNTTVSMSWLSMANAVKTRVNNTALRFTFSVLGPVPSMFNLIWNNDEAVDIAITSIQLLWSDQVIAVKS